VLLVLSNVEVYDIVGKLQKAEIEIDLSHLANGLYFLKINGKMFKIVKN